MEFLVRKSRGLNPDGVKSIAFKIGTPSFALQASLLYRNASIAPDSGRQESVRCNMIGNFTMQLRHLSKDMTNLDIQKDI